MKDEAHEGHESRRAGTKGSRGLLAMQQRITN
jgi:hypothetical protein